MNLCEECGLPILACSALGSYRKMAKSVEQGNLDEAKQYARYADQDYEEYCDQFRLANAALAE